MRKTTTFLSIAAVVLAMITAAIWLLPDNTSGKAESQSYGVSDGLQLVRNTDGNLVVCDSMGTELFAIPVRGCIIDTRYRNGRLHFREKATQREGYIDQKGFVNFIDDNSKSKIQNSKLTVPEEGNQEVQTSMPNVQSYTPYVQSYKSDAQSNNIAQSKAILQSKIDETDAGHRKVIMNYCEHFRAAYATKDIDFIRQVFSDKALIIIGNVVKEKSNSISGDKRVTYARHTKADYLSRLTKVFKLNKKIDVRFSNFRIMRHPTMDGIYGVTLRQQYKSDRYEDDGWLFLLWDFRNPSMPTIYVRTWQPAETVDSKDDVINISDFNLE